jgi:hypothetical protein
MYRTLALVSLLSLTLSGCEALAQAAAQQRAQQQAVEDDLRARIAQLSPEQRDAVQRCSSIAVGKVAALRNAGQGGGTYGINDYTIVDACLRNAYYYETIPAPATVINVPQQQQQNRQYNCVTQEIGGGMSTTNCR